MGAIWLCYWGRCVSDTKKLHRRLQPLVDEELNKKGRVADQLYTIVNGLCLNNTTLLLYKQVFRAEIIRLTIVPANDARPQNSSLLRALNVIPNVAENVACQGKRADVTQWVPPCRSGSPGVPRWRNTRSWYSNSTCVHHEPVSPVSAVASRTLARSRYREHGTRDPNRQIGWGKHSSQLRSCLEKRTVD